MIKQRNLKNNIIMKRKLIRIENPLPHQGFLGAGHIARAVILNNFFQTDPFIALMDDTIDVPDGKPVGGAHPHAGFETVTLILEGGIKEFAHAIQAGDFQMMTAGSGVIHTESIVPGTKLHSLQLWLTLPEKDRWALPRVQSMPLEHVPQLSENGLHIKLYSGSFAGLSSPIRNHVPVIIADVQLQSGANTIQYLPASFNTLLYVIDGSIEVGEERKLLHQQQVGWLDKYPDNSQSELKLVGGESGGRFIIYAGQPQQDEIVARGPFIGNTEEDITRLFKEFGQNKMKHISTLPGHQIMNY